MRKVSIMIAKQVGLRFPIKESIPDFIFSKLGLALEVKFSNSNDKSKSIVDEMNADIQAYSKEYSNLLFLIYDTGFIRNEDEFKNRIDNQKNIIVIIVKH